MDEKDLCKIIRKHCRDPDEIDLVEEIARDWGGTEHEVKQLIKKTKREYPNYNLQSILDHVRTELWRKYRKGESR